MENFYLSIILVQLYACITGGLVFDGPVIQPSSLRVRTPVGEIIGKLKTIQFDGRQYHVKEFLGIPYAEPTNGENRFRKPVPKAVFTAPFNALDYGPVCLQKRAFVGQAITMSEDCLSLNIFVPLMDSAKVKKRCKGVGWILIQMYHCGKFDSIIPYFVLVLL